ncbi:hypothetical protein CYLTODRAFT_198067 [Cylindrobasidium torrendii FP15055 ss-10]|uniref:DUF7918 domain-containing protein n=1 Tax=Cylindrobasidium torrendii FP15055 ss-10 TaxID=1314674 RepID=A0A0D7BJE9_9AGAR|nr:hypothetical protein CYLTODRAFT_198067 [Cylindrobasidium torrendii FP15055 ss-10]
MLYCSSSQPVTTMVLHNGISARVIVDNTDLPEYDTEYDAGTNKISCWIPSESGKAFQVELTHHTQEYDTAAFFYVDGIGIMGIFNKKDSNISNLKCTGVRVAQTSECPLLFSPTNLTDNDEVLDKTVSKEMGEIRVEYHRLESTDPHEFEVAPGIEDASALEMAIHEKKKPVAHHAGLGEKKDVPSAQHYSANVGDHILTVVFRYRPISYLQANGIVPRPTSTQSSSDLPTSSRKRKSPDELEVIEISDTEDEDIGSTQDPIDDMEDEEDDEEIHQAKIARMEVSLVYLVHRSTPKLITLRLTLE